MSRDAGQPVLVVNTGSSSLKYRLLDPETGKLGASGVVERIGEDALGRASHTTPTQTHRRKDRFSTPEHAFATVVEAFAEHGPALEGAGLAAVGHRVVHGGPRFSAPTLVDEAVLDAIRELAPLAPLHNPANLQGLRAAITMFPDVPHVAVFDTAFHQTMPEVAYTYATPLAWRDEHAIRRYGFHGTSCAFVSAEAARLLGKSLGQTNLIVLHLGNGASATAVRGGRSVDTSMGFTPLEGLVMGSRAGDIDAAILTHLSREFGWTPERIDRALNHESGLQGLTGHNDFREVRALREQGEPAALLALDLYAYRIRKYVGAYSAVLGEVDAVVFTAGVGEHSPEVRAASLVGLEHLGIAVDEARNASPADDARVISMPDSPVTVLVVPTNEEWEIARQALSVVRSP